MKKVVSVLLSTLLSVSLASECLTLGFIFPVSFDLSRVVATDFVNFASNREEVFGTAELYISSEGWNQAVEAWASQNAQSHTVLSHITDIDLYFRSALLECHQVQIGGERYFPPWYLSAFYRSMVPPTCACFDELTNYLFVTK